MICQACPLKLADCAGHHHIGLCAKVTEGDSKYIALTRQLSGAPPQLPPLWKQAWNFLQTLWKHLRNGLPQTPARLRKARLQACKACPHFLPKNERCGVCGCFLATKISWQLATCPKGKW
jgi:hypothetical protein